MAAPAFAAGQVPGTVTDSHYAELRRFYSEEQIIDLTAVVSIFGFLNHWNDTVRMPLEEEPVAFAGAALGGSGWEIGKHG